MSEKPPLPSRTFDQFPRVPVDSSPGSPFADAQRIGIRAATGWALGSEGPYKTQMPLADVVDGAVREALLHLLELGFIDIDEDRMRAAPGWPLYRSDTEEA